MFGLGKIFGTVAKVGLGFATGGIFGAVASLPGVDKLLGKVSSLFGVAIQLSGQVNTALSFLDKLIGKHKDDASKLAELTGLQSQGMAFFNRVSDAKTSLSGYGDPQCYCELERYAKSGDQQGYDLQFASLSNGIHHISHEMDRLAHEIRDWVSKIHAFDRIPCDDQADLDSISLLLPRHRPRHGDHLYIRG